MESLYTKKILELWKNPKNYGKLQNPTIEYAEENKVCGDEMFIHMKVENGIVLEAKFHSTGCLICIVFASEITEVIKGMKVVDVYKLNISEFVKRLGVKISPIKTQCARLALNAVQNCLRKGGMK